MRWFVEKMTTQLCMQTFTQLYIDGMHPFIERRDIERNDAVAYVAGLHGAVVFVEPAVVGRYVEGGVRRIRQFVEYLPPKLGVYTISNLYIDGMYPFIERRDIERNGTVAYIARLSVAVVFVEPTVVWNGTCNSVGGLCEYVVRSSRQ